MLMIIEGVDGVGKTTLAERVRGKIGGKLLHRGVPEKHPLVEYTEELVGYRPGMHMHVVCDRWHWGELIYGPLYRGETLLGDDGRKEVDAFLNRRGAFVVHMRSDADTIRERWKVRGEDYLRDEHLEHVMAHYDEVAQDSRVPVVRVTNPDTVTMNQLIHLGHQLEMFAMKGWWTT